MLGIRRSIVLLGAMAGWVHGQPALTTIQDILYRADGTRFSGTVFIRASSFLSGGGSNIATADVTVAIVNGVLQVQLVPTITASAGAQYNVTYASGGVNQFTEVWAVPPSALPLRVRDVRLSSGTVIGPAPLTSSPIQISDVTGLTNALAIRPTQGVGFSIGRTAIINQAGQIRRRDGEPGRLHARRWQRERVRRRGFRGNLALVRRRRVSTGAINGTNAAFAFLFAPSPAGSLILFRNGVLQNRGVDFALAGSTVTFLTGSIPQTGDLVVGSYRYGNPSNPLGTLTAAQVICSSAGTGTSAAVSTQLGSCTIPAGLLTTGDRIEVQFVYRHTGTATAFTGELHWGATTILSRASVAAEIGLTAHLTFGILAGAQSWDTQSWGNSFSLANGLGSATENSSQSLTISFRGQMAASTSDILTLGNFTVIRYPAQSNP